MPPISIPPWLAEAARLEHREGWLAELPGRVAELAERWSLEVGEPFLPGGQTAWVAPVQDADGRELVLKAGWTHPEALHEAAGLAEWAGDGCVLLEASLELGDTTALLLERCRPGTTLRALDEDQQDLVISGLLRRLWRRPEPGHPFRPLAAMCDYWADRYENRYVDHDANRPADERRGSDPGVERAGIALLRELPRTASRQLLLCTDLHAGNVLAAEREPWLVIDPKPYLGDPTYDALQHLLNCERRLRSDPGGLVRRIAGLADLDPDRLSLWLFARCVQQRPSPGWEWLDEVVAQLLPA